MSSPAISLNENQTGFAQIEVNERLLIYSTLDQCLSLFPGIPGEKIVNMLQSQFKLLNSREKMLTKKKKNLASTGVKLVEDFIKRYAKQYWYSNNLRMFYEYDARNYKLRPISFDIIQVRFGELIPASLYPRKVALIKLCYQQIKQKNVEDLVLPETIITSFKKLFNPFFGRTLHFFHLRTTGTAHLRFLWIVLGSFLSEEIVPELLNLRYLWIGPGAKTFFYRAKSIIQEVTKQTMKHNNQVLFTCPSDDHLENVRYWYFKANYPADVMVRWGEESLLWVIFIRQQYQKYLNGEWDLTPDNYPSVYRLAMNSKQLFGKYLSLRVIQDWRESIRFVEVQADIEDFLEKEHLPHNLWKPYQIKQYLQHYFATRQHPEFKLVWQGIRLKRYCKYDLFSKFSQQYMEITDCRDHLVPVRRIYHSFIDWFSKLKLGYLPPLQDVQSWTQNSFPPRLPDQTARLVSKKKGLFLGLKLKGYKPQLIFSNYRKQRLIAAPNSLLQDSLLFSDFQLWFQKNHSGQSPWEWEECKFHMSRFFSMEKNKKLWINVKLG